MKSVFYWILLFCPFFLSAAMPNEILGVYRSNRFVECPLTITLSQDSDGYQYQIETPEQEAIGEFHYDENEYIVTFLGLKADDPNIRIIEVLYGEASLHIQNTGNAMNPYTLFSGCGLKYIELTNQNRMTVIK